MAQSMDLGSFIICGIAMALSLWRYRPILDLGFILVLDYSNADN